MQEHWIKFAFGQISAPRDETEGVEVFGPDGQVGVVSKEVF